MKGNSIVHVPLVLAALLVVSCSGASHRTTSPFESAGAVPHLASLAFTPSEPTTVTGRVLELKVQGAWIDLDDRLISYDSLVVELSMPVQASGKRVYLQYQGEPFVSGHKIRPGQIVTFTLPVVPSSSCCEPYLEDIADIRLIPDGS